MDKTLLAGGQQVGLGVPQQQGVPILGYADGGMIGMQPGMPQGSGMPGAGTPGLQQPGAQMDPKMADMHINQMYQVAPQLQPAIMQVVQQGIQSGEITPQELNMAIQLARAVLGNPSLWPRLRQFAIQQGLVGPNDLPQEYDQSVPLMILSAAKALEGTGVLEGAQQGQIGAQPQPGGQPGQPQQALANGGMIVGPGTGRSDSVPAVNTSNGGQVKVSNGEYVIPAHVVAAKGKDFFDGLLRKYAPVSGQGNENQ